jgi:hypothetical protein
MLGWCSEAWIEFRCVNATRLGDPELEFPLPLGDPLDTLCTVPNWRYSVPEDSSIGTYSYKRTIT